MNNTRPPEETAMALSPEAYERKKKNTVDYNKKQTTLITIRLNNDSDADILSYLQTASNKQGLIKELLRNHMAKEGYTYEPDSDS